MGTAEGMCWSGLSQGTGQQEVRGAEWSVCRAEPEGIPLTEGPCPANDMVLCLLHSCLGQELSDREIPLSAADQATFLSEVLQRTRYSPGKLSTSFQILLRPRPFLPISQGGFCLWVLASLSSPQSLVSLLELPSSTHLYPHCRSRGATSGGPWDTEGSASQQHSDNWRLGASCHGQHWFTFLSPFYTDLLPSPHIYPPLCITGNTRYLLPMTGCCHSTLFWILQALPFRVEEGRGVVGSLIDCSNFVSFS